MKRPFLETPAAWTRAARTSETAAEAAYAVRRVHRAPAVQPHEAVMLVIVAIVVVAILFGGI